ncbi:GldG family protein [Leadbettera azotonutricia]|uniref:Uncharacterized protein n=1 Tax=Leadbettera azotonutricia (strain ATCC BAA-888 / DSM 13862 / ZAS-9) TaxID=545695 RepID=F5YD63_LEAAZ|nr:Gldg family protein [Leadbettera azotonutricia]AEF81262.1 conserved hypothetical protein [Leadbettera azotonutricia ZAS-9]
MKEIKGFKYLRDSFRTKQVKYGGYAALITLAVIAGLILVNLIIAQFTPQIDLTYSKLFSLSEQSIQVLDKVNSPVNIYGLWRPGEDNSEVTEVVDLYIGRNKNIHFQVMDPDKNPGFLVKYDKDKQGIARGSVIVEGAKGFRVIPPQDMYDVSTNNQTGRQSITGVAVERRFTSALLFAGTGETPVLYEITGHEERALSQLGMKETVERENFSLKSINLVQSSIPPDASGLILNAPRADISRGEADKILAFLENGGRLLILADYRIRELPILNETLSSYGLRLDYGVVQENDTAHTAGAPYVMIPEMAEHDITKPLSQRSSLIVLPFPMGISELPAKRRSVGLSPLLSSSQNSWLRTDLEETANIRVGSDIKGPITIAMTVMDPQYIQGNEKQARIVVIAAASLLEPISSYQQIPGNLDFFMNSLTWLEDRPEALAVRSKSLYLLPLRLNGLQMIIFSVVFVLLIPLAFFITGLVTWLKRRHL